MKKKKSLMIEVGVILEKKVDPTSGRTRSEMIVHKFDILKGVDLFIDHVPPGVDGVLVRLAKERTT